MTRDFSKYQSHADRKSHAGAAPDLRRGKKPAHSERMKQVYADKRARNEGLNNDFLGDRPASPEDSPIALAGGQVEKILLRI